MYRCTDCGVASSDVTPSWDPRFASGKCASCGYKVRSFTLDSVEDGKRLKEAGQERAEGHVAPWSERARRWIVNQPRGATYTSEDITADLGQPPSSGAVGAVMTGMAKGGYHEKYMLVKAQRPNQHAAEIWTWIRR